MNDTREGAIPLNQTGGGEKVDGISQSKHRDIFDIVSEKMVLPLLDDVLQVNGNAPLFLLSKHEFTNRTRVERETARFVQLFGLFFRVENCIVLEGLDVEETLPHGLGRSVCLPVPNGMLSFGLDLFGLLGLSRINLNCSEISLLMCALCFPISGESGSGTPRPDKMLQLICLILHRHPSPTKRDTFSHGS